MHMLCYAADIITFISQAQPLTLVNPLSLPYHKMCSNESPQSRRLRQRQLRLHLCRRNSLIRKKERRKKKRTDPQIAKPDMSSINECTHLGCNPMVNRGCAPSLLSKTRARILSPCFTPAVSVAIMPFCTLIQTSQRKSNKAKQSQVKSEKVKLSERKSI